MMSIEVNLMEKSTFTQENMAFF